MSGMLPQPPGGPPPMPQIPGLVPQGMRAAGMQLGSEQVLAYLLPPKRDGDAPVNDSDEQLAGRAAEVRRRAASCDQAGRRGMAIGDHL